MNCYFVKKKQKKKKEQGITDSWLILKQFLGHDYQNVIVRCVNYSTAVLQISLDILTLKKVSQKRLDFSKLQPLHYFLFLRQIKKEKKKESRKNEPIW